MQLCICKHVRSIHTHCIKPFATISGTFIEIVILYAHGALINHQICSGGCCLRGMHLCICKHVRSIHTHCIKPFATISGTFIEIVILYAHGALIINQICSSGCCLRGMQLCICKHVRSIHTHCIKPFATISGTFIEIVILYANGALINQLNFLWWMLFKRYATMHLQTCS